MRNEGELIGKDKSGDTPTYTGISGWLILPAIGWPLNIIESIILTLRTTSGLSLEYFPVKFNEWHLQHDHSHHVSGDYFYPNTEIIVLYTTATGIGLLIIALAIYTAVRFYLLKINAPRTVIIYMIVSILGSGANLLIAYTLMSKDHNGGNYLGGIWAEPCFVSLIVSLAWVPYFLVSNRVKKTFVH